MSLKYGKAELAKVVAAIDRDHPSPEAAALAALEAAEEVFEKRAKFTVVGQITGTKEEGLIPQSDPRAIKAALGWYSTEGNAQDAASSLWYSASSGDTWRCWVLPVHHGTPASLHSKRKEEIAVATKAAKDKAWAKVHGDIAARAEKTAEDNKVVQLFK